MADYTALVTDAVGLRDVVSRTVAFGRTVTDAVGVTDPLSRQVTYSRVLNDRVGVTDPRTVVRTPPPLVLNDRVGVSDAPLHERIPGIYTTAPADLRATVGISPNLTPPHVGSAALVPRVAMSATGRVAQTGALGQTGAAATAAVASGSVTQVADRSAQARLVAGDTGLLRATGFSTVRTATGTDRITALLGGSGTVGAITASAVLRQDVLLRAVGLATVSVIRGGSGLTGTFAGTGSVPFVPTGTGALRQDVLLRATGFAAVSVRAQERTSITAGTIFVGDTRRTFSPDALLAQEVVVRCVGTAVAYLRTTVPRGISAFVSSMGQQDRGFVGRGALRVDVALTAAGFAGVNPRTGQDGIAAGWTATGRFTPQAVVGRANLVERALLAAKGTGAVHLASAATAIVSTSEQQAREVIVRVLTVIFPPVQAILNATGLTRVESRTGADGLTATIRAARHPENTYEGEAALEVTCGLGARRARNTNIFALQTGVTAGMDVSVASIAADVGSVMPVRSFAYAAGAFGGGGHSTTPVLRVTSALACTAQPETAQTGRAALVADGGILISGANLPVRAPATTLHQGSSILADGYSDTRRLVDQRIRSVATLVLSSDALSLTTTPPAEARLPVESVLTCDAAPIVPITATLAATAGSGVNVQKVVVTPGIIPQRADLVQNVLMLARPGVDVALITVRVSGIRLIGGPCYMTGTGVTAPASSSQIDLLAAEAKIVASGAHTPKDAPQFIGRVDLTPTATMTPEGSSRTVVLEYGGRATLATVTTQEVPGPYVVGGYGNSVMAVASTARGTLHALGQGGAVGEARLHEGNSGLTAHGQGRTDAVLTQAVRLACVGEVLGGVTRDLRVTLAGTASLDGDGFASVHPAHTVILSSTSTFDGTGEQFDTLAVWTGGSDALLSAEAGLLHVPNTHYAGADLTGEARISHTYPGAGRVRARARVSCTGYDGSSRSASRLRPQGDRLHSRARPVASSSTTRASSRYAGSNTATPDSAPPPLVVRPSTGTASPSGGPS